MRRRTFWKLFGGALLILLLVAAIAVEWIFGLSELLYRPVSYRVTASVELGDHGRMRRSAVTSDCWALVATRGVRRGVRKSRRGEDNHFVLGDGSVLVLSELDPCRWVERVPPVGTTVALVDADSGAGAPSVPLRAGGEALRFDNAFEPTTVTIYDLTALFTRPSDGLVVDAASLTVVAARTEVMFTLEERLPWLRAVPGGNAGRDLQEYWELHHQGNFLGFRATVTQLPDDARCPVRDPSADGPVVIAMQAPCTSVRLCMQRAAQEGRSCGTRKGWLAASVDADFGTLSYSIDEDSDARIAVLYRESMLARSGAPGDRSNPSMRWTPRICMDGLCVTGETAATGVPPWTQFYYPARNQLVTVWPLFFYAADAFRRNGASF
jgi:hypothetical protein